MRELAKSVAVIVWSSRWWAGDVGRVWPKWLGRLPGDIRMTVNILLFIFHRHLLILSILLSLLLSISGAE